MQEYVRSDDGPKFIARWLLGVLAAYGTQCRHIVPGLSVAEWSGGAVPRDVAVGVAVVGDIWASGVGSGAVPAVSTGV